MKNKPERSLYKIPGTSFCAKCGMSDVIKSYIINKSYMLKSEETNVLISEETNVLIRGLCLNCFNLHFDTVRSKFSNGEMEWKSHRPWEKTKWV